MRTLVLCSVILGTACGAQSLHAQSVSISPIQYPGASTYVPGEFTAEANPLLTSSKVSSQEGTAEIKVYDENLDQVAGFTIPAIPMRRALEVAIADEFKFDGSNIEEAQRDASTQEEVDALIGEFLNGADYKIELRGDYYYAIPVAMKEGYEENLGSYIFYEYAIYGDKYPARAVLLEGYGSDFVTTGNYKAVYFQYWQNCYVATHWGDPQVEQDYGYMEPLNILSMLDYNESAGSMGKIVVTQTLFNSDADYEYVAPLAESYLISEGEVNGCRKYSIRELRQKGFRIMSSNGNELQSVEYPEGAYGPIESVVTIGEKTYLVANAGSQTLYYAVDRKGGHTRINSLPVAIDASVAPTMVSAGEPVRVEVRDTTSAAGLTVIDMGGRTVYSALLPGEGAYQIPGSAMSRGMNVVTLTSGDKAPVSTKVLVK